MPSRWPEAAAWLILGLSLLATGVASHLVARDQTAREHLRFSEHTAGMVRAINRRMTVYQNLLIQTGALWRAEPDRRPDVAAWGRYVEALDLPRRYPGIQGVGLALRVDAPGAPTAERLTREMRREGHPAWHVWPKGDPAAERYPVALLEPLDRRNEAALGYDMFSEPVRQVAMVRARDEGTPALSARVTLVQEIDAAKQPGFLLYVPVYRGTVTPPDLAARREAIAGFTYAPFRAGDLFSGVFQGAAYEGLGYRIYDGERPEAGALLVAQDVLPAPAAARFHSYTELVVAGRPWLLEVWTPEGFPLGGSPLLPWLVGLGGAASGFLLFGLVRTLATSRARALALAEDMTAELRAADRAKDEWLSVISHELRTPLNFIMGFASLLDDDVGGRLSPEQRAWVARINLGADRMLELVDDLLDVAKMTAGRFELTRVATPYASLIEEGVASLGPLAERAQLQLAVAIAPDVRELALSLDGPRVVQVLTNLVGNAVKFTPAGGRIDVLVRREGQLVRTEVRDTGIGISVEDQARLFQRFRQVDMSSTRVAGGTGLGLSISKGLIEAHGGHIGVVSAPGEGSTFWFTLPVG